MAVNNIKKINVRSPYYIEVGNTSEEPVVPDITEPVVPVFDLRCGYTSAVNGYGVSKWRLNMSGREFGDFVISVTNIRIPIKMRVYNEGATAGAWITKGRDSYAEQWLEATGEDDSELTSRQGALNQYPAIGHDFTYDYTQSESDTYGDSLIFELLAPIGAGNILVNPTCQPQAGLPVVAGQVKIITIEHRGEASLNSFNVYVNGVSVMDNTNSISAGSGIRLVYDDTAPDIAPASNDFPYPQIGSFYTKSHIEWDYPTMDISHVPQSDFNVNGQTVRIVANGDYGIVNSTIRAEVRNVEIINGVRTITSYAGISGQSALFYAAHSHPQDFTEATINITPDGSLSGVYKKIVKGLVSPTSGEAVNVLTNK